MLLKALKDVTLDSQTSYQHGELFPPRTRIHEPYHLIFYHWEKFEAHAQEDVKKLLNVVKESCPDTFDKFQELQSDTCTKISFADLWLLYRPETTILTKDDCGWRAYKVERFELQTHMDSDSMTIYVHFLDFDSSGQWLVPHREVITIYSYSGDRAIGNLEAIPAWYFRKHHNDNLLQKLVQRGKEYDKYRGSVSYREYNGDAWPRTPRKVSNSPSLWHEQRD